jgi:hypothetical protein
MAKREIKRHAEETEPVATTEQVEEGQAEEQEAALPAETPARPVKPVEVKDTDFSVTFDKFPSYMAIRILRNVVLFNDGRKMRRENIVPGKPVTIEITQ